MDFVEFLIDLAVMPNSEMSSEALELARFSLLDWMVCGLAGTQEPVALKLRALAEAEGGNSVSSVIGGNASPARMAAMVNGTTSHALDYDDTHFAHVGHLSVAIYPAVLAVAEERNESASAMIEAFLAGAESAIRVGIGLGPAHYEAGFHQTATAGAFGAVLATGRLMGLSRNELRNAIGLCATRASGLISQFGTMGKPYNAGIAAANGVECAKLAALGMISTDDGLMGQQGFFATHMAAMNRGAEFPAPANNDFMFLDNKYKLHACCHGTHAMIEALRNAEDLEGKSFDQISAIALETNPRWLRVCDIKSPRTGLEIKFSYNWLAGMVVRGDNTADNRIYSDCLARDEALSAFARKITVTGNDSIADLQAKVTISLSDGARIVLSHDLAARMPGYELERKLRDKAVATIGTAGVELWERFSDPGTKTARELGNYLRDSSCGDRQMS